MKVQLHGFNGIYFVFSFFVSFRNWSLFILQRVVLFSSAQQNLFLSINSKLTDGLGIQTQLKST